MITVYRLFQLIMGIILSGFILYILLDYAGGYAIFGQSMTRQKTLDVFIDSVENVYFSGNPTNFTKFIRANYRLCYPSHTSPSKRPVIQCFIEDELYETRPLTMPVFMNLAESVLITRGRHDLGWLQLDYVKALRELQIVFNPLTDDDYSWDLMKALTLTFPDTSDYSPKLTFGLCSGNEITPGHDVWERDDFYIVLLQNREGVSFEPCTAGLSDRQILVTVSPSCSPGYVKSGICFTPPSPEGLGFAYVSGSPKAYIYKDPLDIAALLIGGERESLLGPSFGEETWETKNRLFLETISLAAEIMESRCTFVYQNLPSDESHCGPLYLDFQASMSMVKELARGDHHEYADMLDLNLELEKARDAWQILVNRGCESLGAG